MTLLEGVRVVDMCGGIAGPYASKMLADAGADVVKVEGPKGDPLRGWTASGTSLAGADGALFQYLNTSKRSVIGSLDDQEIQDLVAEADILIEDGSIADEELARLRRELSGLVIVSVTPFGRSGPFRDHPSTEFTLQAWCGSTAGRGAIDRPPIYAGGRLGEWISGAYAAVGALGSLHGGVGDHVDVSMLECMSITLGGFGAVFASFTGMLDAAKTYDGPVRSIEVPSIHPTADGLVGFCTVTGQQFEDFLVLIDQAELVGDERFSTAARRSQYQAEFEQLVGGWTSTRTTEEIVDLASAFRVPVSEVGTPDAIASMEQFVERGIYVASPDGGFVQPRPPFAVSGVDARPFTAAPVLGSDEPSPWPRRDVPVRAVRPAGRPLEGVRIVDLTAFWAGPAATQVLGALGADVIKVEGLARPDGMRFGSVRSPSDDVWWEASPVFHAVNTGKRAITLDLGTEAGRELLFDLIEGADGLIENFSPRVLDTFGVTWDAVHARNPRAIMMRMPSFGLDGPWRDRTGFAQTMEQVSGMAWITGFPDAVPVIPRGACDPLAGMHATVAFLAALLERERSGEGRFIEVPMVEAALNCAAEVVIEHSAYGASLKRDGNRGPVAAPQGIYLCAGTEQWLALAVADDQQWMSFCAVLAESQLVTDRRFATGALRRQNHDELDQILTKAVADRDLTDLVDALLRGGVPAAPVVPITKVGDNPQLRSRGFVEAVEHPVVGTHDLMGLPFRLASRGTPWFERAAPTLGQHNDEVLGSVLGLDNEKIAELEAQGVIGSSLTS